MVGSDILNMTLWTRRPQCYIILLHWGPVRKEPTMERRKDSKGRVLKKGESERKDGRYQYRYIDAWKKRQTIYASDLKELRDKETQIQKDAFDGIDYSKGKITVCKLLEDYFETKKSMKRNTQAKYSFVLKIVKESQIGSMKISEVTPIHIKKWATQLYEDGKKYSSIKEYFSTISPAFKHAVECNIIKKNPFSFPLSDVIPKHTKQKLPLSSEEQSRLLEFVKNDKTLIKYYNEIVILLETGLRISELCGLTVHDVNFHEKTLSVSKQLCIDNKYGGSGELYIESTKSSAGERIVPLSKKAIECFDSVIKNRKKVMVEPVVDGYSGFIFIRDNGEPKCGGQYTTELKYILKKYNSKNPEHLIQKLSPHVLRHTFCTNMLNAGLNIKSLQYIMGHSTANITLNVYSHSSPKMAAEHFRELENRDS